MKQINRIIGYLFLGIFMTTSISTTSQVFKLRATSFSSSVKLNNHQWGLWSPLEESSVLIVISVDDLRITIYSKVTQVYDIIGREEEQADYKGNKILQFHCIDNEGISCGIRIVTLNAGGKQLYVDYNDMSWLYNIYIPI